MTKVSHASGQPFLCDQLPIKTLTINVQVSIPGWQYLRHVVTHWFKEGGISIVCMTLPEEDNWKVVPGVSWTLALFLCSFLCVIFHYSKA